MGSGRWSFAHLPATHLLLCSPVLNRPRTGTSPWPGGLGPLAYRMEICHKSPFIIAWKEGHWHTIAFSLLACSQHPATVSFGSLQAPVGCTHMDSGLKSEPIYQCSYSRCGGACLTGFPTSSFVRLVPGGHLSWLLVLPQWRWVEGSANKCVLCVLCGCAHQVAGGIRE